MILEKDATTSSTAGTDVFWIDTHLIYASTGTNQDRWLSYYTTHEQHKVYINKAKSVTDYESHWKFVPVTGKENVYYIQIAAGSKAGRHLEFSSLDSGLKDPFTRTTSGSTKAGAPGWDEWMLVTPEDYAAATRTDYTSRIAHDKSSWHATGMWGSTDFVEHYLDPTPAGNVL